MVKRAIIVGVMGAGDGAVEEDRANAFELGRFIGANGWVLLTGGREAGVMAEANRGAREQGGLTVGILPGNDRAQAAESVIVAVVTGMGNARNNINVLSSDVVVVLGARIGPGTASEAALALKAGKPVILVSREARVIRFFRPLASDDLWIEADANGASSRLRALVERVAGDPLVLHVKLPP